MSTEVRRKPGRPRSQKVDTALEQAVLDVLASRGYAGLRVDDVAAAAGISKTTIYRRAPTKAALVADVLQRVKMQQVPMPDTGTIAGDLRTIVRDQYESLDGTSLGRAMAGLLAEKQADPDLAGAIEALWSTRQEMVAEVIRRGVASGELRADVTELAIVDLLAGPAYYRLLVTGQPLDRAGADRHADALVAALTA